MIGQALAARLAAAGHAVCALGREASAGHFSEAYWMETRRLPGIDAPEAEFRRALAGAAHVVHCAALNNDRVGATPRDFMEVNAVLTARLASAAAALVPGRFVFLSSIRAVVGPVWSGVLDEATPADPACDYGRSKREGEKALAAAYRDAGRAGAAILRLPPVYGAGMKGMLAKLLAAADTPLPLPLASLAARRSLISVEAAARAVTTLLESAEAGDGERAFLACDREPIALPEIVSAFREGLGRPARLFPASPRLVALAARLVAGNRAWESLTASQICTSTALQRLGWTPDADCAGGLRRVAGGAKH